MDELLDGGLLAHIGRVGRHMEQRLAAIAAARPIVKEVRGAGLIWGLELDRAAAPVVAAALSRGIIINRTAETVVRLLPPLVITAEEIDEGLSGLDAALGAVESEGETS
jgi:acetylornithine/succinyldiaminopimelate/putrescine aminotransferase